MLVGDLIMMCRELITDVPQALGAPAAAPSAITPGGNFMQPGTYFGQLTAFTPWGASAPSTEFTFTIGATQTLRMTVTSPISSTVTKYRVYLTFANGLAGTEQLYVDSV